jgi:pyruvate/2-oxoglutarate dehydrogenase complex dihydrolipoamide acyltransferase (E2) component
MIEVKVPDIGDYKDIPVIEVLVKVGDVIRQEDSLITLESDKATMDVPAPASGTVRELKVKVGDKVSQGHLIMTLESSAATAAASPAAPAVAAAAPRSRAATCMRKSSCWVRVRAATPPHFGRRISARRSFWWSEVRHWVACVSMWAAFRPRRCCMPREWPPKPKR